jgi:ABC-2 type transport system permease protein
MYWKSKVNKELIMSAYKNYIENFKKYRFLLYQLIVNDIKVKYRRSILGVVWSVLNPLMMMVVFTLIFSTAFSSDIKHFAVYVLTGRIIWDLYSQSTAQSMQSIIGNEALIKKMYVPKYIFPLAKCCVSFINTSFSLFALVIVVIFSGGVKLSGALVMLPFPLIYTFLFAVGVSFILSAYTVFFRDLQHLYEVLLTAWMYFTPLFYPVSIIPDHLKFLVEMNPIYWMLSMFREIIMDGKFPDIEQHLICAAIGLASLIIGALIFRKRQEQFILYV